jgi:hypothetical protein
VINLLAIVEGHGEVSGLPVLSRRLPQRPDFNVSLQPIRVKRDQFLNDDHEFKRMMLFAAHKAGVRGRVLIVLDADDDCPSELGAKTLKRAQNLKLQPRVAVVIANRETEAWLMGRAA